MGVEIGERLGGIVEDRGDVARCSLQKKGVFGCHFDEHREEKSRYGWRFLASFEMALLPRSLW